jgi:hypothetical protein
MAPTLRGKDVERFLRIERRNRNRCATHKEIEETLKVFISVVKRNPWIIKEGLL